MNKIALQEVVIADEFKIIALITIGKHAQIYRGLSIKTGKEYAIKIQSKKQTSLQRQASLLLSIHEQTKTISDYGLPVCYCFAQNQANNCLVQDLFGPNLEELLKKCKGMLKINSFITLADQMIRRIQTLHQRQYLHRRIALSKWAIGLEKNSKKMYLLGFSRCKHYIKDGIHINYSQDRIILNEVVYASINNHLGIQPSRRDDLQSIVYCWVKMLYGSLPWQHQTQNERVLSKKVEQRGQVLFANFPNQLKEIAKYIRGLNFSQKPDYERIRNLLMQLRKEYNEEYSGFYDWEVVKIS